MQTFEARILDKIGEALAGDLGIDTEMLDDWCTEGARYVVGIQPPQLWRMFAKEDAAFAPTTGIEVENHKIIDVFRNDGTIDQPCRMIPEYMRGRALDSSDINYATVTDPEYYVDASTTATPTLKIIPVSATATIGKVRRVSYPTVDASADSSINGFPDELEDLVVDYALMQAKQREAIYMRRQAQSLWTTGTTGINARALDALTKAQEYMDTTGTTQFESYMTNEDVELAQSMVQGASQEVNRALAEMQTGMSQSSEYLKLAGASLQDYQTMEKSIEKRLTDWIGMNLQ